MTSQSEANRGHHVLLYTTPPEIVEEPEKLALSAKE